MTRIWLLALALIVLPTNGLAQTTPASVDVTGPWVMALDMAMGIAETTLVLKQEGEKISGTYTGRYGAFAVAGTLEGQHVEFSVAMTVEGQPVEMVFTGEVASDNQSMEGDADLDLAGTGRWSAVRDDEDRSDR